jgi:hypothetical protein
MNYTFFYIKKVISDAHTLDIIYNNTFPWLWRRHNIYNKHTGYIQLFATMVSRAGIYEQSTIQRSGNIHYSFST